MTTSPPPDDPMGSDEPADDETVHAPLTAPAAPDGVLDGARLAAMDAFDEQHGTDRSSAGTVRELSSARSVAWYQRIPLGAVAAAVAVIALVGVFTQLDLDTDRSDIAASDSSGETSADADDSAGAIAQDSADPDGADDAAESAEAPAATLERATITVVDVDALVVQLSSRYTTTAESDATPTPPLSTTAPANDTAGSGPVDGSGFAGCGFLDVAGVDVDDVLAVERALVAGDETIAVVYASDAGLRVAVVDSACALVADRAL